MHDDLPQRKQQHLDLVQRPEVEPEESDPLFRCVKLVHRALPEVSMEEIDLRARLCGVELQAPLMIVGMTGGTERAAKVNADLAQLAQEQGIAFGVGSMRVVLDQPEMLPTFTVPSKPPLLMANLGAQQLAQRGTGAALKLIELLKADGICIHLNPAQELVQEDGDRDFRGCLEAIGALVPKVARLIVKETGCGIGPQVAKMLVDSGVTDIDVSGMGGSSWPRVEQLRAKSSEARSLGEALSSWGIPTAACVASVRAVTDATLVASGGVRSGLDAVRALALGANVAGIALPMVRAHHEGGIERARSVLQTMIHDIKSALLLCGARSPRELKPILFEPLTTWIEGLAQ